MIDRSNRREVRNPVLSLPAVKRLNKLTPGTRAIVADIVSDLVSDARPRAQQWWVKNKGPIAAYWKAVGSHAQHFRRVVKDPSPQPNLVGSLKHVGWLWKHPDTPDEGQWHYEGGVEKPDPGFSPSYAERVVFEKVFASTAQAPQPRAGGSPVSSVDNLPVNIGESGD